MGYRDDFYVAANFVGYTGEVQKMPSVYFQNGDEYGHITQFHSNALNIGRGPVREDATYAIVNRNVNGAPKCHETLGGKSFHRSRNEFIPAASVSAGDKGVLMQAITKYTDIKGLVGMSSDDRMALRKQVKLKAKMLDELINEH